MNKQTGWENWETQLNRKVDRRRSRSDRKAWHKILSTLVGLLSLILLMILLDAASAVSKAFAMAVIILAFGAMFFIGGWIAGKVTWRWRV